MGFNEFALFAGEIADCAACLIKVTVMEWWFISNGRDCYLVLVYLSVHVQNCCCLSKRDCFENFKNIKSILAVMFVDRISQLLCIEYYSRLCQQVRDSCCSLCVCNNWIHGICGQCTVCCCILPGSSFQRHCIHSAPANTHDTSDHPQRSQHRS